MLFKKSKNKTKIINFQNIDEVNKMVQNNEKLIIIDSKGDSLKEITDLAESLGYKIENFNLKN